MCQTLLVLVRAHSLSAVAPRSALGPIQPPLYISLSLSLSSLSPALPPASVIFEPVHCDMRFICIVNAHPVECAELSYNCLLEMASWLFFCFSQTQIHTLNILEACVSFESAHCDLRLICIVDTYPVECSELSYNCLLKIASWLFSCFSHTHTHTHTHTRTH